MSETRLSERVRAAFGKAQGLSREYDRVTRLGLDGRIDAAARAADEAESERDTLLVDLDALTARLAAAERERDEARAKARMYEIHDRAWAIAVAQEGVVAAERISGNAIKARDLDVLLAAVDRVLAAAPADKEGSV